MDRRRRNVSMDDGNTSTSTTSDSERNDSSSLTESDDDELKTPKKKKYKRSIHHGFSRSSEFYYKKSVDAKNPRLMLKDFKSVPAAGNSNNLNFESVSTCEFDGVSSSSVADSVTVSDYELSDSDTSTSISVDDKLSNISETSSSEYVSEDEEDCVESSQSISDTEDEFEHYTNKQDEKLFENSTHTIYSSYSMIMLFVMKHSLLRAAFSDLLMLIKSHLPQTANFTTSVYFIKETLKKSTNFKEPTVHRYCGGCQASVDKEEECTSDVCQREKCEIRRFYDLNLEDQLKSMIKDKELYSMLERKHAQMSTEEGHLGDISDGVAYMEAIRDFKTSKRDKADICLTFTMNTDGVSLFSSSNKGSLWPVYLAINEIPIKLRYSRRYIIPCLLHCEVEKPNMMTYLSPLMKELQHLYDSG